jgi:hypothetical protein
VPHDTAWTPLAMKGKNGPGSRRGSDERVNVFSSVNRGSRNSGGHGEPELGLRTQPGKHLLRPNRVNELV